MLKNQVIDADMMKFYSYIYTMLLCLGENIFALTWLIIPVNIPNQHWFVICVDFVQETITAYDTSRYKFTDLRNRFAIF